MRLNRVLLLAATISIMIFAMVFTISCSGDDGKNGKDGKGCNVEKNGNDYDVYCGDENVGKLVQGPKGDPGSAVDKGDPGPKGDKGDPGDGVPPGACVLLPQAAGIWPVSCGGVVVGSIGGGGSVGGCAVTNPDEFNKYEIELNCGTDPIPMCNGRVFDKSVQVCTNGKSHLNDSKIYNTSSKKYIGLNGSDATLNTSSGKYYNNMSSDGVNVSPALSQVGGSLKDLYQYPTAPTAAARASYFVCGTSNEEYNPNEKFCIDTDLKALCGGSTYNATTPFDTAGTISVLGSAIITGTTCSGSIVMSRCVDGTGAIPVPSTSLTGKTLTYDTNTVNTPVFFDADKQFCRPLATATATARVEAVGLCGDKAGGVYNGVTTFCENGKVVRKCAGESYDDKTHFCYANTTVAPYCTGDEAGRDFAATSLTSYDPSTHFCQYKNNGYSYKTELCNKTTGGATRFNATQWDWSYCVSNTRNVGATPPTVVSVLACSNPFEAPFIKGVNGDYLIDATPTSFATAGAQVTPIYPASVYAVVGYVAATTASIPVDCGCIEGGVNNFATGNKCACPKGIAYDNIRNVCNNGLGTSGAPTNTSADPCAYTGGTGPLVYFEPANSCVSKTDALITGATTTAAASIVKCATGTPRYVSGAAGSLGTCEACPTATPQYNPVTNTCQIVCADPTPAWDATSNTCRTCAQVNGSTAPVWVVSGTSGACGLCAQANISTPLWSGTACTACATGTEFLGAVATLAISGTCVAACSGSQVHKSATDATCIDTGNANAGDCVSATATDVETLPNGVKFCKNLKS